MGKSSDSMPTPCPVILQVCHLGLEVTVATRRTQASARPRTSVELGHGLWDPMTYEQGVPLTQPMRDLEDPAIQASERGFVSITTLGCLRVFCFSFDMQAAWSRAALGQSSNAGAPSPWACTRFTRTCRMLLPAGTSPCDWHMARDDAVKHWGC